MSNTILVQFYNTVLAYFYEEIKEFGYITEWLQFLKEQSFVTGDKSDDLRVKSTWCSCIGHWFGFPNQLAT